MNFSLSSECCIHKNTRYKILSANLPAQSIKLHTEMACMYNSTDKIHFLACTKDKHRCTCGMTNQRKEKCAQKYR